MQMIAIPDALDAMQRNIKLFLNIATGGNAGIVDVAADRVSGTASINHYRDGAKFNCHVRFPAMPAQHRLSRTEVDRWVAYFIHELCHAVYTDNAAWSRAVGAGLAALVNGMEDVRIEREFNDAGTAANSRDLLNVLMEWAVDQCSADYNPNDPAKLPWTLAMFGRVRICGYAIPAVARYDAMLSPMMRKLVDWTMVQLAKAQSTDDVLAIAQKIQRRLASGKTTEAQGDGKASPEATEAQGDGKASPEATEAQGDGKASPEATEAQGDGKAGTGNNGTGLGDGTDADADELPMFDATKCEATTLDPASAVTKAIVEEMAQDGHAGQIEAVVIAAIREAQETAGKPFSKLSESDLNSVAAMADMRAQAARSGKLKAQVARVLKSEESETWERARPTGRLDRFAYAKMAGGDGTVFAKRTIAGGYQTEIEVLCDGSGSMSGLKSRATAVLALVIAQAAQQVGVKCGVSRFTDSRPRAVKLVKESLASADVAGRFARLYRQPTGMTNLTGAIVQTSAKLAARAPGKRKLLFVVSDGDCGYGPEGIKRACAYAKRLDVETVVLCIDTPIHPGFGLAVQCDSVNVQETGLDAVVRALSRD